MSTLQITLDSSVASREPVAGCPFKHEAGVFNYLRNAVNYFRSPDAMPFITDVITCPERGRPYDASQFPFVLRKQFVVITNDKMIAAVLRCGRFNDGLCMSEEFYALSKALGDHSPLTCQGREEHTELRKLYKESTFHSSRVKEIASSISGLASAFIEKTFAAGGCYVAQDVMLHYALEQSLAHIVKTQAEIDVPKLAKIVSRVEQFVTNEILWSPSSFLPTKWGAIHQFEEIVKQVVQADSRGLINDLKERGLNDQVVLSAARTAIAIGAGTTRSLLVSVILCLINHPLEQEKFYQAAKIVAASESGALAEEGQAKLADAKKAIKDFFKEVRRLYPPILGLARRTDEEMPLKLGDETFIIPEGASLILSVFHCQRHPDLWDDPETFDSSRYSNQESRKGRMFEFGDSSSRCLGEHFALSVIESLICPIVLNYRIVPPLDEEGIPIEQHPNIRTDMTLKFDEDVVFRLEPRD